MNEMIVPVDESALLVQGLIVGAVLFGLGLIGFLVRRNVIVMFLCAEMMLQGVSVSFVAWGRYHDDFSGQMMVIFIIAIAACEAAIALALILNLFHRGHTLDMVFWQDLREEGQPAFVDREVPEELDEKRQWPGLTVAGVTPPVDLEEQSHRSRV